MSCHKDKYAGASYNIILLTTHYSLSKGLNAPIPDGCSFGYHAGGWGKPPVDEQGKPLYGDVFGTSDSRTYHALPVEEVDHTLWGEMDSESEEEESSDEEEEEEEEEAGPEASSGSVSNIFS